MVLYPTVYLHNKGVRWWIFKIYMLSTLPKRAFTIILPLQNSFSLIWQIWFTYFQMYLQPHTYIMMKYDGDWLILSKCTTVYLYAQYVQHPKRNSTTQSPFKHKRVVRELHQPIRRKPIMLQCWTLTACCSYDLVLVSYSCLQDDCISFNSCSWFCIITAVPITLLVTL